MVPIECWTLSGGQLREILNGLSRVEEREGLPERDFHSAASTGVGCELLSLQSGGAQRGSIRCSSVTFRPALTMTESSRVPRGCERRSRCLPAANSYRRIPLTSPRFLPSISTWAHGVTTTAS